MESPDRILAALLHICGDHCITLSELHCLLSITLLHLNCVKFQELLVTDSQVELLLGLILRAVLFPEEIDDSLNPSYRSLVRVRHEESLSSEDAEQRGPLKDLFFITLRDVSSLSMFISKYPYDSSLTSLLKLWLQCRHGDLQIMACIILGNLARANSGWAYTMVLEPDSVHHDLINMLSHGTDRYSLLIAFDFLLQLAKQAGNRALICQQPFLWAVARQWKGVDSQIQYAATTVLRGLLRDCPLAVLQLLHSVSAEIPNPRTYRDSVETRLADPWEEEPQNGKIHPEGTYLSKMLAFFLSSSDLAVTLEIQKISLEICRCLPRLDPLERHAFLVHANFATPIIGVITQNEDMSSRAQGYLALVLIAHEPSGLAIVQECLKQKGMFEYLVQGISGKAAGSAPQTSESPPENMTVEQWNIMLRSVRENARWLVKEVLESSVSHLRPAEQDAPYFCLRTSRL